MTPKKLLVERYDIKSVKKEGKDYYLEGIFIQTEIENANGRIYPKDVMDREVKNYIKNFVKKGNALGQLNHPMGEAATVVDLKEVSHLITDLRPRGNNYVGRAKLLDTPNGIIAKNLIDSGVTLGMSTRGVGSTEFSEAHGGAEVVADDFVLLTAGDIVFQPSAPEAYMEAIVEEKDWLSAVYSTRALTEAKQILKNCNAKQLVKEKSLKNVMEYLKLSVSNQKLA